MPRTLSPKHLLLALLFVAFAGFGWLVATSPDRLIYDEPHFVQYVPLLHEHGFSRQFLVSLSGTAGPLYAFVQAAFEPITLLQPAGMRLVNVALLVVVASILVAASARDALGDRLITAGSVLVVPMTWVLAGMALSEMPALVFATLSLFFQFKALQSIGDRSPAIRWFLASAVCLGVAAWGRQPYLLLAGVPLALALMDARLRMAAGLFLGVVLAMVTPLFIVWGGFTPPSHHFVQQAPTLYNSLVSLGYAGFALALVAPGVPWRHRGVLIGLFAVVSIANCSLSIWAVYPLRGSIERLLPGDAVSAYGLLCGAFAMTSSIATLAFIFHLIWKGRADPRRLTTTLSLLCMCLWPAFMGANFSSRYMAMGLPYLLLAVEPLRDWNVKTLAGAAVGCTTGALALLGYYAQ